VSVAALSSRDPGIISCAAILLQFACYITHTFKIATFDKSSRNRWNTGEQHMNANVMVVGGEARNITEVSLESALVYPIYVDY
jgi:hypothetical protein